MATQTGYKASELGMIPQDWEIRRIGDFAPLQRGFDLPNSEIQSGDYPVVYSNGIGNYHNCYTVKSPCIATGRSGTLGKVHYVEQDCWVHNTSLWVTKFDNCEPKFIYFLFQKIGFERFASGSGVPTLNRNDAHEFKIALPKSTAEQTAIATALSDTDALISSLQTLIAKKKAIKLSAMQNLLGGKIRLSAFAQRPDGSPKTTRQTEQGLLPEDWEVVELGEIGYFQSGVGFPLYLQGKKDGEYPVFKVSDLNNIGNEKFMSLSNNYIDEDERKNIAGKIIPENAIIFAKIGAAIFLERKRINKYKSFIDNNMMAFIPCSNLSAEFLYFCFLQIKLGDMVEITALPALSSSRLKLFKIAIPKSTTEQTAIAQLLSDMDAEIEALEGRLKKTQALKQGMMQALLTGKIRLPLE